MSTRSGKRVHLNSFHENIMKPEMDLTRSERKTRSKHTKENFDEPNKSPMLKKRNYVAYPATDEAGVDTVDSKDKEKLTRVLRKNTLKERNILTSTESVEPTEEKKSTRSTRRTRKFEEAQDTQDVEPIKVELTKQKKVKKKKVEREIEEVKVPKKKSKKKKGRRSSSTVVEDMEVEAPSSFNKSNMSVDSFHSAAGSPRNLENCNNPVHVPLLEKDLQDTIIHTPENNNKTAVRKTRSALKFENNMLYESDTKKEPRKRKSTAKENHESKLNHDTSEKDDQEKKIDGEFLKHKSSTKDVTVTDDTKNSTFDLEASNITRKSTRSSNFDKTATPIKTKKKIEDFDEEEPKVTPTRKNKKKSFVRDIFEVSEEKSPDQNTVCEKDSVVESGHKSKKRKSSTNTLIKLADNSLSAGKDKKKSLNDSIEKDLDDDATGKKSVHAKFNLANNSSFKTSPIKYIKDSKTKSVQDTFEKDSESESDFIQGKKSSVVDITFDVASSSFKSANEVSSPLKVIEENDLEHKSVINTTYEKDSDTDQGIKHQSIANTTFDKEVPEANINTTFEKDAIETNNKSKRKSSLQISSQRVTDTERNSTFDIDQKKLDTTFDKNSKSSITSDNSMITLDKSDDSRISITSDESKNDEIIVNTTPVLIESSMEVSVINTTITPTKETTLTTALPPATPLKREGTFTKDEPVMPSPKPKLLQTPTKRTSLPSPGFTPFHINPSKEKSIVLNVTKSIEKRRSSLAELPRQRSKVMFCSPVNNPAVVAQNRRKVIKSNLKGSNKSFVFDESVSLESRPRRKRSYTQSDAEEARVKRKRLGWDLQQSVDRLARPRTSSASAKLAEPTTPSKKPTTPSKKDTKLSRTKLPNFAALHQKQFDKMESLDECQERKAKRAKQLLTPTGAVNVLEKISPRDKASAIAELDNPKGAPEKTKEVPEKPKEPAKKPETPIKSLPTFKSLNPGYTRFGFKLNLDVNPFSIPSKTQTKPKEHKPSCLNRQPTLPSLAGATSVRREVAKQTVMREKSFTDRRNAKRTENRTVIKGVRTNRRFELQMRMREL